MFPKNLGRYSKFSGWLLYSHGTAETVFVRAVTSRTWNQYNSGCFSCYTVKSLKYHFEHLSTQKTGRKKCFKINSRPRLENSLMFDYKRRLFTLTQTWVISSSRKLYHWILCINTPMCLVVTSISFHCLIWNCFGGFSKVISISLFSAPPTEVVLEHSNTRPIKLFTITIYHFSISFLLILKLFLTCGKVRLDRLTCLSQADCPIKNERCSWEMFVNTYTHERYQNLVLCRFGSKFTFTPIKEVSILQWQIYRHWKII